MSEDNYICPICGSEVRVGSNCTVCADVSKHPEPRKSWEQDEGYDGLDLPDEDFDYDEFVEREFSGKPHRELGIKFGWWLTAAVLVVVLILLFAWGWW